MFCVGFRTPDAANRHGFAVPPALEAEQNTNMSEPRPSLSGLRPFGALPGKFAGAGTVPKDGEARQGGTARRISWSTVSASTPNMRWLNTFKCPRTRTWRVPNSSLRRALVRSTPERIR